MNTTGRLGPRRLIAADVLVAGVLTLFALSRTPDHPWPTLGLLAVLVLPLVVRRRWPNAVFVVVLATGATATTMGFAGDVVVLAIAFALYPVALRVEFRPAVVALVAAAVTVLVSGTATVVVPGLPLIAVPAGDESFSRTPVTAVFYSVTVLGGSWMLARALRARREHAAQLVDLTARHAVAEERLRIARDIHDVVGHNLSLIAMKAAVANHLVDSHPEEGRAALTAIERVSRGALDDVRSVLDALRGTTDTAPGGAEIEDLVADVRAAGVAVDVDRADLSDVPAAVRASAYRIAQEALTNVLRHAGPTVCHLALTTEPGLLTVTVLDEGMWPVTPGPPRHGLLGMRERVALHGGAIEVGPTAGGGFGVTARLPYLPAARDG